MPRKEIVSPRFLATACAAMAIIFIRPAAAANAPDCNKGLCETVVVEPISLYGGQAAGLAMRGNTLYVAENANNLGIVPQGPLVLAVNKTGSKIITPAGLLGNVTALALDREGDLYIADGNGAGLGQPACRNLVWKIAHGVGTATPFLSVNNPTGLAFDSVGNLYVSSYGDGAVYKYSPTGQLLSTPLSNLTSETLPYGLALDNSDNLYVAIFGTGAGGSVWKVTPSNVVTVFIDISQTSAGVSSLVFDQYGNLYASYYNGLKIVRIAPGGSFVVFPGGGVADDAVNGLAYDGHGDLFTSVNGRRTTTNPAVVALHGLVPAQ